MKPCWAADDPEPTGICSGECWAEAEPEQAQGNGSDDESDGALVHGPCLVEREGGLANSNRPLVAITTPSFS